MNLRKISLYLFCLIIGIISCKKDDDPTTIVVELEDRDVQQLKDMDSLNKYLDTHYYNSEYIASLGTNVSLSDIVIGELGEDETVADIPVGSTLLRTAVGLPKETKYADTDYEYYVLNINQGGGSESPKFCDKIRFNYEGFTLDDVVFDYSVNPIDSDLIGDGGVTSSGLIPGWSRVIPEFNTAESYIENGDGTVGYVNKGVGIMFLPSGLAYFSSSIGGSSYSPIIFKFELLQMSQNDHDGDGIPSYLEDLNGDGQFTVNYDDLTDAIDDDTNGDGFADYLISDDDGDGILTKNEITITTINKPTREEVELVSLEYNQVLLNKINKEQNGSYTGTIITFKDTDGVKPFDYLDKNY